MQSLEPYSNIVLKQSRMVLGISSFAYGWAISAKGTTNYLNEQDLVRQTINFGLQCLQIGDNLPLHTLSSTRLSALSNAAHQNNIRLEVGGRGLTEDHLYKYLEITASLHSPLLRFVIDRDHYEPEIRTIIPILKNILPHLKKHNIILGLDNLPPVVTRFTNFSFAPSSIIDLCFHRS